METWVSQHFRVSWLRRNPNSLGLFASWSSIMSTWKNQELPLVLSDVDQEGSEASSALVPRAIWGRRTEEFTAVPGWDNDSREGCPTTTTYPGKAKAIRQGVFPQVREGGGNVSSWWDPLNWPLGNTSQAPELVFPASYGCCLVTRSCPVLLQAHGL